MREKDIEARLVRHVKRLGGLCYKFTSPGHAGVPDRIIFYKGKTILVELKAPGAKPRPNQSIEIKRIKSQAIPCLVLDSKEKVDWFIERIRK